MPENRLGQPIGPPVPNWKPARLPDNSPMEGHWCRLEPLDPDRHAAGLFEANALDTEGRQFTYLSYGPFSTLPEYRAWMEQAVRNPDYIFYAILDKAGARKGNREPADGGGDGQPVGVASYLRMDPANGAIEVGNLNYSLRLQKTAAATEAMYLMMQWAFENGYRRYEWKCDALNGPSRAAALRLGFTFEGIFRQAVVYKGRNRDTAWHSILDREWPALQPAYQKWLDPANFDADGKQKTSLSVLTKEAIGSLGSTGH